MSSAHPRLFLVRHGETEWSRSGQHTGTTDIPLTDNGRELARTVGRFLAGHTFDRVLTSPMSRARETCTLMGFGPQAEITPNLTEWNYGIFEGLTTPQIREQQKNPEWTIWTAQIEQGESLAQVGERAQKVIDQAVEHVTGDVLLVAHGHILRMVAATWLGLAPMDARLLALLPATLSILGYEHEQRVLLTWNRAPGDRLL